MIFSKILPRLFKTLIGLKLFASSYDGLLGFLSTVTFAIFQTLGKWFNSKHLLYTFERIFDKMEYVAWIISRPTPSLPGAALFLSKKTQFLSSDNVTGGNGSLDGLS